MTDPISIQIGKAGVGGRIGGASPGKAGGDDFASIVRDQHKRVSDMQSEADENVRKLVTGESQNMTDVFVAARKAEVAFSLLMEIRNKLLDSYQELQNMRI